MKTLTEEQLTKRLKKAGKTKAQIEELINQYVSAIGRAIPDTNAISELLKKTQEDTMLRVKSFALTGEEYDALLLLYKESNPNIEESNITANLLVQYAFKEFIKEIQ
jgi:hypothetical protein